MVLSHETWGKSFTSVKQSTHFLSHSAAVYRQIDKTQKQIRLLCIEPDDFGNENIRVHVTTVSLDSKPEYEAVSYVWGDVTHTRTIKVDGFDYEVTVNQWAVLRRLRCDKSSRFFWMDAICINQADHDERAQQVEMMSDIYSLSQRSVIWLGEPVKEDLEISDNEWRWIQQSFADSPDRALLEKACSPSDIEKASEDLQSSMVGEAGNLEGARHILHLLRQDKHVHELPFYLRNKDDEILLNRKWFDALQALYYMAYSSWWFRVWIIQEAFLSPSPAQVITGPVREPLANYLDAAKFSEKHDHSPGCCTKYAFAWGRQSAQHGNVMLRFAPLRFVFDTKQEIRMSLLEALNVSCWSKATDLRDHVYGVLGLVRSEERIQVSYKKDLSEVYTDVTFSVATSSADICWLLAEAIWLQQSSRDLPSWCRDFSQGLSITMKPMALVLCRRLLDEQAISPDCVLTRISPGLIQTQGQLVDLVEYTWEVVPLPPNLSLKEKWVSKIDVWWSLLSSYQDDDLDRRSFWKILLWDCWADEPSNTWSVSPILSVDQQVTDRIHSGLLDLTSGEPNTAGRVYQLYADTYRRVFDECRPLLTKKGYVGSGPLEMEDEDQVYRINGCPLPIVLRQIDIGELPDEDRRVCKDPCFKVVGLCYIREYVGQTYSSNADMVSMNLA